MVQTLKSQINILKVVMNKEYLKLVNVTLYKEVESKCISSSVSQFVLVALVRPVGNVLENKESILLNNLMIRSLEKLTRILLKL